MVLDLGEDIRRCAVLQQLEHFVPLRNTLLRLKVYWDSVDIHVESCLCFCQDVAWRHSSASGRPDRTQSIWDNVCYPKNKWPKSVKNMQFEVLKQRLITYAMQGIYALISTFSDFSPRPIFTRLKGV